MPNWFSGLNEILDKQSRDRKQMIEDWNSQNAPIIETDSEDGEMIGVFHVAGQWHYGFKKKNGYHPEQLVPVPDVVFHAWAERGQMLKEMLEERKRRNE